MMVKTNIPRQPEPFDLRRRPFEPARALKGSWAAFLIDLPDLFSLLNSVLLFPILSKVTAGKL